MGRDEEEVCTHVLSGSLHCAMVYSAPGTVPQAQHRSHMPSCCFFAVIRFHQAPRHPREPVQALSGAVDENLEQLPALLCSLHQTQ